MFAKMVSNAEKLQLTVAPVQSLPPIADIDTFHVFPCHIKPCDGFPLQDLRSWTQLSSKSDAERVVKVAMEKIRRADSP